MEFENLTLHKLPPPIASLAGLSDFDDYSIVSFVSVGVISGGNLLNSIGCVFR